MKNKIVYLVVVLILVAGGSYMFSGAGGESGSVVPLVHLVAAAEFNSQLQSTAHAVVLDVRTPAEYQTGHIADAINIDFENVAFASEVQKLDTSKTYFVYCRSGNRSAQAVTIMKKAGIKNIVELKGGILAGEELLAGNEAVNLSVDVGADVTEQVTLTGDSSLLSEKEQAGLVFMREEEKLAYDVYMTLAAKWNLPVFSNIASSEQTHTNAVKSLLDKYKIADPVTDPTIGVFTNPDLQKLYNDLTTKGLLSLSDALVVGATIEDLDIRDLELFIAETNNSDLVNVYNNLLKGSRNHLRSFYGQITRNGGSYQAQYITAAELLVIVSSEKETGGGMKRGRN